MKKVIDFIKKYIGYIVGVIVIVILGILTISTANKLGTGKLMNNIKEYFFLRSRDYKRKGSTIKNEDNEDIPIPSEFENENVTGIGSSESSSNETNENNNEDNEDDRKSGEGGIKHKTTDRKNTTPIENSFKYKKTIDKNNK